MVCKLNSPVLLSQFNGCLYIGLRVAPACPAVLDYDEYWNSEIAAKLADFERITKDDYRELLRKNGFIIDHNQRHLF